MSIIPESLCILLPLRHSSGWKEKEGTNGVFSPILQRLTWHYGRMCVCVCVLRYVSQKTIACKINIREAVGVGKRGERKLGTRSRTLVFVWVLRKGKHPTSSVICTANSRPVVITGKRNRSMTSQEGGERGRRSHRS